MKREQRLRAALVRDQVLENAVEARLDVRERARTAGVRLHELQPERARPDTLRRLLALQRRADLDCAAVPETDGPAAEVPPELRVGGRGVVDDVVLAERAQDLRLRHPELELADADAGRDRLLHRGCAQCDNSRDDENPE